jgi:hypothetical protein
MSDEPKSLSDIWLDLQSLVMENGRSKEEKETVQLALDALQTHIHHDQEKERKIILRWFTARLSNRLFSSHYEQLLLELANLMSTTWVGKPEFTSLDEVLAWLDGTSLQQATPPVQLHKRDGTGN